LLVCMVNHWKIMIFQYIPTRTGLETWKRSRPHKHALDLKMWCQATRLLPRFELDDGVLWRKMRWPFVFMVFFHCLWVLKKRTDVIERV